MLVKGHVELQIFIEDRHQFSMEVRLLSDLLLLIQTVILLPKDTECAVEAFVLDVVQIISIMIKIRLNCHALTV